MKNDRDHDLLLRITEHCNRILDISARIEHNFEAFASDQVYQDAIFLNIFQIGELANKLSLEFKDSTKDIPWKEMYGIRNIIAHAYIIVDKRTVWETVEHDIPDILAKIKELL